MELEEAVKMKEKLEEDIKILIISFTKSTGLTVADINFIKVYPYTGGFSNDYPIVVEVKVEI
jgi:hypothetical protein